jgi:hypothetical protein
VWIVHSPFILRRSRSNAVKEPYVSAASLLGSMLVLQKGSSSGGMMCIHRDVRGTSENSIRASVEASTNSSLLLFDWPKKRMRCWYLHDTPSPSIRTELFCVRRESDEVKER